GHQHGLVRSAAQRDQDFTRFAGVQLQDRERELVQDAVLVLGLEADAHIGSSDLYAYGLARLMWLAARPDRAPRSFQARELETGVVPVLVRTDDRIHDDGGLVPLPRAEAGVANDLCRRSAPSCSPIDEPY